MDGKIVAVGPDLTPPEGGRTITGAVVCAGFIDPWSCHALDGAALFDERSTPATRAIDALDPFVDARFALDVLRSGVTAARVQSGLSSRAPGLSALVRHRPGKRVDELILLADCTLSLACGTTRGRGLDLFDRIGEVDRAIGSLADGRTYLDDQTEHRHELAEWEKKVAESEKELEEGFKKAKKDRDKELAESKEKGKEFKEKTFKEDKRPKAPRFDEDKEQLARAVDGRMPCVVEAHRQLELRGLLDATRDYDRLRLIIAGGTDAGAVAEELARRKIPVIVVPAPQGSFRLDEQRNADPALAGNLQRAGVRVLIGSGGTNALATRDLPVLASIAIGHGLPWDAAFEALTSGAAEALDVSDRVGSLDVGKEADILVLSGEPLASTTRTLFVLSQGEIVVQPEN
jgi:imidazolonepropionase-like amidohydrolase